MEAAFFSKLAHAGFSPSCVVDVGGSNAAWSRAIAEVFPDARYELFEPLAGRRDEYDRVLEMTLRTHPRFRMHNIALGTTNGVAEFWYQPHGVGSSLIAQNSPAEERISVPVRRLDDYRSEHAIAQPQLMKLDVQGGELQVLQGAPQTTAACDALHIETWLMRGYGKSTPLLPEIMDFLRPLGHLLVQIGDYWRKPSQELVVLDAFFVHERLIDRLQNASVEFPWPQNWTP
jgi:FkbM family methyltransferase